MMSALYNNGQAHQTPNMAHCDTQQGAQTLLRLLRIAQRVEMDVAANEMTHGAQRLGTVVRENISADLAGLGIGTFSDELLDYQEE